MQASGPWAQGADVIQRLLDEGRLERRAQSSEEEVERMFGNAAADLASARREKDSNPRLAYRAMYDAVRTALTAALEKQGLRVKGGEGSHVVVFLAVSAQVGPNVTRQLLRSYDRMRNRRHQVEYDNLDVTAADVFDDLPKAERMVAGIRAFTARLSRWEPGRQ